MNKYYDVHNHLFNKHFLGKELLYRMMKELRKFIDLQKDRSLDRSTDRGLKKIITSLKRYRKAIKVFSQKNSIAIYEEINKTYENEFILTPLTFDLTYCFAPSADRNMIVSSHNIDEAIEDEMNVMFNMVEEQTRSMSRVFNPYAESNEDELWNEFLEEKELFLKNAEEFQRSDETPDSDGTRGIFKKRGPFDGWNEQLRQIEELKKHPVYKDMVYPFLAIDPRRPGIAEYAKKNVGKGKLFAGVKLYCPTGYSPTDPLLFGSEGKKDGIYAFCEDNGIPVTVHNSDGGFATLAKSVVINGLIHVNGKLIQLNNELLKFSKAITEKDAIYERALAINHPLIWGKVAEKYPNLLLNLAHFGGGRQLEAAMDNPENQDLWSNRIIELLKDKRYNVHTDLSCFSAFSSIEKLIASEVYPEIKNRILYGSDYTLLLLFEDNFDENVRQFRNKFGNDFDIIARKNPEAFLKHVI
ncbi:MAG TPA: amidohydrolase family protein [Draconibacterium sp.]|nr:amidohydrolase family protein [Draconibacterium sp.]